MNEARKPNAHAMAKTRDRIMAVKLWKSAERWASNFPCERPVEGERVILMSVVTYMNQSIAYMMMKGATMKV